MNILFALILALLATLQFYLGFTGNEPLWLEISHVIAGCFASLAGINSLITAIQTGEF